MPAATQNGNTVNLRPVKGLVCLILQSVRGWLTPRTLFVMTMLFLNCMKHFTLGYLLLRDSIDWNSHLLNSLTD